jgi:cytochrome c oxidase subunit 2
MQTWFPFIPESASTHSGDVDAVYFYVSGVTVFFCTLIWLVIFFFVVRYRRRNAFEIPRPIEGSHKLETLWSVIPLVIAMSIFVWGAKVYFAQYRPPQNALEVTSSANKWMWKFQHPTGQREINELHVPVGRKVKLIMTTEDVDSRRLHPGVSHQDGRCARQVHERMVRSDQARALPFFLRRVLRHESLRHARLH